MRHDFVDATPHVSVVDIKRAGALEEGQAATVPVRGAEGMEVECRRREGDEMVVFVEPPIRPEGATLTLPLYATEPAFGGLRWWFLCLECGKPAGALFIDRGQPSCRTCRGVVYRSTHGPARQRQCRRRPRGPKRV